MSRHRWKLYGAVTSAALLAYQLIPESAWWKAAWQVAVGYGAVAAVLVGAHRLAPGQRAPWWCFAAGLFGNVSGIAVAIYSAEVLHVDESPTVADPLFLTLYPACALGVALLLKRREPRRNWAAMVDAGTFAVGLGVLAWVYVIAPAAHSPDTTLLARMVSIAYPVGDLLLLAMLTRLLRSGGTRGSAFWWIAASCGAFFVGDTAWVVLNNLGVDINGLQVVNRGMDMIFLTAYSLFGVAALHPSARELDQAGAGAAPRLSLPMLASLAAATLIAPVLLGMQLVTNTLADGLAIVLASAVLFLLVVTRMAQLVREVERQAAKVQTLSRQDELTGLPNRRAWNDDIPRALKQAQASGAPVVVAMIDLDHFKKFNDTFGHPAGDRLLVEACSAWRGSLRAVDTLARFGGEEFIALLPGVTAGEAATILRRTLEVTPLGQTFSAGFACWDGTETAGELIARADAALYRAKEAGRNRVVAAEPIAEPRVPRGDGALVG
ncbi:GGDEF domain-containing protein [Actinoplanes cyaneus]|nr:GGDEF domain-containing protein [Actinoplanes cyaneus]MCW2141686.1 diguanylate cyclase (GGDEF) domain-containing protein [Actinoplanes cyaneus]